jgi:hypothetical protein
MFYHVTEYACVSTPLSCVALWVICNVCAYVRVCDWSCGSGSSLTDCEISNREASNQMADAIRMEIQHMLKRRVDIMIEEIIKLAKHKNENVDDACIDGGMEKLWARHT